MVETLEKKSDDQEQYSRRNCILVHGLEENKNEIRLQDSGMSITESLNACRIEELSKAHNEHGFKNVWTIDGKILFKENGSNKAKLFYG